MKTLVSAFVLMMALGTAAHAQTCASLVKQWDATNTSSVAVYDGQKVSNLGDLSLVPGYGTWDNKVDKVVVNPGCVLVAYQYQNYNVNYYTGEYMGGFRLVLSAAGSATPRTEWLRSWQAEKMSSLRCYCGQ